MSEFNLTTIPREKIFKGKGAPAPIVFSKEVFDEIESIWKLRMADASDSGYGSRHSRNFPYVGMLGVDANGVVVCMRKVGCHAGGCWNMPRVKSEQMITYAVIMGKKGLVPKGLVRIGKFDIDNGARGNSLSDVYSMAKDFFIVSAGYDGFAIQTYSDTGANLLYGYSVKKVTGIQKVENKIVVVEDKPYVAPVKVVVARPVRNISEERRRRILRAREAHAARLQRARDERILIAREREAREARELQENAARVEIVKNLDREGTEDVLGSLLTSEGV